MLLIFQVHSSQPRVKIVNLKGTVPETSPGRPLVLGDHTLWVVQSQDAYEWYSFSEITHGTVGLSNLRYGVRSTQDLKLSTIDKQ